jgi:colanic acid biosynthesis glycosyl transferase WcaI
LLWRSRGRKWPRLPAVVLLPRFDSVDGVEIYRVASTGFGRHTVVGRAADYATFHLSVAKWLAANTRADDICIVCTDPPLLSATAALSLAFSRATMVNWVMDLFPEVATELGMLPRSSIAARLATALRDWTCRHAALTVCPIDRMARFLESRGTRPEQLSVLHHWSDGQEIFPVAPERNRLRREWGLNGKFVVGYSGNFGRAHEFDTLLKAAELLKDEDGIRFLLIGDGNKWNYVAGEVRRRGLTNILMKPLQPKAVLAESLCASDVHIVSLLPQLEHCIVPSKFYGILAAGRPVCVVGDKAGEVATAVVQAGCGTAVEIGQSRALATYIRAFRDDPQYYAGACATARHLFETRYTLDRGLAAWRDTIDWIRAQGSQISGRSEAEVRP